MPAVRSKRYRASAQNINRRQALPLEQAVALVKERASAKFDESIELAIKLDIDTKQSDQLVRGSMSLPHGTGKNVRVIAFCEGEEAEAALANGAIAAGGEDLCKRIQDGWLEFDVAIAHPKMMRFVGKLGRTLGPKGLMPSPKSGTVTDKTAQAVKDFSAGKIEYRNDKEGNIHLLVGKASFDAQKLVENIRAAMQQIVSVRPQAVKGEYMTSASVSSTMGPGVRIAI